MPERVYMNRVPGEERIHVEFLRGEIPTVLADLAPRFDVSDETRQLIKILHEAFPSAAPTEESTP